MSFSDCGFLIRNIQLQCNDIFGHQKRDLFHEKKCDRIRFDYNDDVKEILKKIEIIEQRKHEFHNCGNLREMYTKHKPPCKKSHLDPSDQKHIVEYEKMYTESQKCQQNLKDFYTIVQQQIDNYKKNPDPERPDILYKKYVIYLYNSQKKIEEEIRVSLLKEKEKKRKEKDLLDIAEKNKKELEEFEKQKNKEKALKKSIEKQKKKLLEQEQLELLKKQKKLLEEQLQKNKKQQTKDNIFIKKISSKIKETNCNIDFLLTDSIETFLLEINKTIDDPIVFKIICYIHISDSYDILNKIKKHFNKIYQNLI